MFLNQLLKPKYPSEDTAEHILLIVFKNNHFKEDAFSQIGNIFNRKHVPD